MAGAESTFISFIMALVMLPTLWRCQLGIAGISIISYPLLWRFGSRDVRNAAVTTFKIWFVFEALLLILVAMLAFPLASIQD